MALTDVPASDTRGELERLVDEAIEGSALVTCERGVHVQDGDELWCAFCGDFIVAGADVIAPAL